MEETGIEDIRVSAVRRARIFLRILDPPEGMRGMMARHGEGQRTDGRVVRVDVRRWDTGEAESVPGLIDTRPGAKLVHLAAAYLSLLFHFPSRAA